VVGVRVGHAEPLERVPGRGFENVEARPTDEDTVVVENDGIVRHRFLSSVGRINVSVHTSLETPSDDTHRQ
jgi:hypothetical protein